MPCKPIIDCFEIDFYIQNLMFFCINTKLNVGFKIWGVKINTSLPLT